MRRSVAIVVWSSLVTAIPVGAVLAQSYYISDMHCHAESCGDASKWCVPGFGTCDYCVGGVNAIAQYCAAESGSLCKADSGTPNHGCGYLVSGGTCNAMLLKCSGGTPQYFTSCRVHTCSP